MPIDDRDDAINDMRNRLTEARATADLRERVSALAGAAAETKGDDLAKVLHDAPGRVASIIARQQADSLAQIARAFTWHHVPSAALDDMATLLVAGRDLAHRIVELVPPCRERLQAISDLADAIAHARAGIARSKGTPIPPQPAGG